ncbi:hypothetical protein TSUD_248420 [Trifolium subterraneum]|uniref:Uncharacterized protein n=1 Tax=Trifolium subterraneum TaxID=3900 RepID=A0A2Z6LP91_TRISU|nr:hypothetical protein TSUD_248420 [Trifolium subterraneum]
MGASAYDQSYNGNLAPLELSKKRKTRSRGKGNKSVAEILAKWREYNERLYAGKDDGKPKRKAPAKVSSPTSRIKQEPKDEFADIIDPSGEIQDAESEGILKQKDELADIIDPGGGEIQDAKLEETQKNDVMQIGEGVCNDQLDQMDLSWIDNFDFDIDFDFNGDDNMKNCSMDEFFQVDELLGHLDNNPVDESGLMQSLDCGQMGFPEESNPQVGTTPSFFYELENPDAKLLGSLPHMEQPDTTSGVDYALDFYKIEEPVNCNGALEDTPYLDLNFDDVNYASRGM